jgi:hypothetical protein
MRKVKRHAYHCLEYHSPASHDKVCHVFPKHESLSPKVRKSLPEGQLPLGCHFAGAYGSDGILNNTNKNLRI